MFPLKCVFIKVIFLYFSLIPVTNAGGEHSKGQTSRLTEDEEQLVSIHEPLLGDSDRDRGPVIDERIRPFIEKFNMNYLVLRKAVLESSRKYETTGEERYQTELDSAMKLYEDFILREWREFSKFEIKNSRILDGKLKNQAHEINYLIRTNLPTDLRIKIDKILKRADNVYYNSFHDGAKNTLRNSNDVMELLNAWKDVDKNIGGRIKPLFGQYYETMKEVAKYNGFSTVTQFLMYKERIHDAFTLNSFHKKINLQCSTFYSRLWVYMGRRLRVSLRSRPRRDEYHLYGFEIYELGRINAENKALTPLPRIPDTIKQAIRNKSSTLDWLELANNYYSDSLGFEKLNTSEIRTNLIELRRTTTATRKDFFVWNYFNGDYRIMWKPSEPEEDMRNMFKAVGYIHNFRKLGRHEPIHQSWVNEVFGEAIVGAISLSAFSPSGLTNLGVLSSRDVPLSVIVNRQLKNILRLFMTFELGMLTERQTHALYNNEFRLDRYLEFWWEEIRWIWNNENTQIRLQYFPPGTIENLLDGTKYIKEAITEVLKYQFFQRLCDVAGNTEPLHRCYIHTNENALTLIKLAMQQGNSLSWKSMMYLMTGSKQLDASPLLNYYRPLSDWLYENVNVSALQIIFDKVSEKFTNLYKS